LNRIYTRFGSYLKLFELRKEKKDFYLKNLPSHLFSPARNRPSRPSLPLLPVFPASARCSVAQFLPPSRVGLLGGPLRSACLAPAAPHQPSLVWPIPRWPASHARTALAFSAHARSEHPQAVSLSLPRGSRLSAGHAPSFFFLSFLPRSFLPPPVNGAHQDGKPPNHHACKESPNLVIP